MNPLCRRVKYGLVNQPQTGGMVFVMNRSVGNLVEQSAPFLVATWLNALTCSPDDAAWLGWLWLLLRSMYPVAFAFPSMSPALWGIQRRLGISGGNFGTWPSYLIIGRLLLGAARACS